MYYRNLYNFKLLMLIVKPNQPAINLISLFNYFQMGK